MSSDAKITVLVKLRDSCRMASDAIDEFLDTLAPESVKRANAVPEQTFSVLKWVGQTGERLGQYETADKKDNASQAWENAFAILDKAQATISNRYYGLANEYRYAYWIFGQDRIFRQILKKQN